MLESRQARRHEDKIICPGNQKTEIEQFEPSLPWVPCRHGGWPPASIHHGKMVAAGVFSRPCFGGVVFELKGQTQGRVRHLIPPNCRGPALGDHVDNMKWRYV